MDVDLIKFINAITKQTGTTTEILEGQDKINSALTKQLDAMTTELTGSKKTKSTLDSKIGELSKSSVKTEEHLGKLNKTLDGVASVMQQTNTLTAKQTKLLQKMDPGGRRLLGDTYDSTTGRNTRSDKQLLRAIKGIKGGMGITKGLVTAGMGFGGYKLLSFLMNNRMLLAGLGLGGGMAPGWMTGDVGFREGLLGENSWLRKNFYGQGGYGGAAADFAMDNPWWTLGGAAAVGTRPGRALLGAAGRGTWAVGTRVAPWAYGGMPFGGQAMRAAGGRMIPTVGTYNPALAMTQAAQRPGGAVAQKLTPQTMKQILGGKGVKQAVKKAFDKGAVNAIKNGANREMAKRAGALIAARTLQGLGMAATGVGTVGSVALWMYTIYEIADMFADPLYSALGKPGGWIAEWWVDSHAEKMAKARDKLGDAALLAKQGGVRVQDESGRFLDAEEMEATGQRTKADPFKYAFGITGDKKVKNKLIAGYLEAIKDPDVKIYQKQTAAKNRIIKKILDISDGKEFLNGNTWSHKELAEAPYEELWNLYWSVVLPRASSPKAAAIRKKHNMNFEGGMTVKGSRAASSDALKHAAVMDPGWAPSEPIFGLGGGPRKISDMFGGDKEKEEAERLKREADKATLLHEGLGGLVSLKTWAQESNASRAELRAAINAQSQLTISEHADKMEWTAEQRKYWNDSIDLQQQILDKPYDMPDATNPAANNLAHPTDTKVSEALKEPKGNREDR